VTLRGRAILPCAEMGMLRYGVRAETSAQLRCASVAGLEEVPVIVHKAKFKDEDQALRIVENLKRRTVTIDEAIKAVRELDSIYSSAEITQVTRESLSEATGYSAHMRGASTQRKQRNCRERSGTPTCTGLNSRHV